MFHPVGSQPASVYWRRRLVVLGSIVLLIVLLALTIGALTSGTASGNAANGTGAGSTSTSVSSRAPRTPTVSRTAPARSPSTTRRSSSTKAASSSSLSDTPSGRTSTSAPPALCRPADLAVQAVTGRSSYHEGDKPMVEMQVTNNGATPCVQDLADKQIELTVYNGVSRVWGSHDCQTMAGTNPQTLLAGRAVRVTVKWSGLSSQPGCKVARQRVGPGTYTLYAKLAGKTGTAGRFTITA